MVLGAEVNAPGNVHTTRAFGTPTVVHFCAVLLISALLSAPWHEVGGAAAAIASFGVAASIYAQIVASPAHRQPVYQPVLEDWIWHTVLPVIAYAALFTS